MSDQDSGPSAAGSPADASDQEEVELVQEKAPSPIPAPTAERSASPSPSVAESVQGRKGKGRAVSFAVESQTRPRHAAPTLDSSGSHIMSRSLTMDSTSKPPPKYKYGRRNRGSKLANSVAIGPKGASDGEGLREGIAYSSGEVIVPGYHSENPTQLPKTPRQAPLHKAAVQETPYKHSSDSYKTENAEQLQKAVGLELDGTWMEDEGAIMEDFHSAPGTPGMSRISDFLSWYSGYNNATKKWVAMPDNPADEDATVYLPMINIMNAILGYFRLKKRRADLTYNMYIPHQHEAYEKKVSTKPDILLVGHGDAFSKLQGFPDKPTYEHCAAPVEMKLERNLSIANDEKQLAVYARECFVQQPNRRFVYALLLTEKRVRVYQFDRGGVLYSQWYDIGTSAITFVQIILAIASEDENQIGFDTRIRWVGEERYFEDPQADEPKRYKIINPDSPFRRRTIRGRGTTCWKVVDDLGHLYMLKFSWKTIDRVGEWEHLERIKNANPPLKHVGTMDSYRVIQKLSDLRHGVVLLDRKKNFHDREYYYTLQTHYGSPLEKFRSVLQLYRAFRDAVSASMELLQIGIVHRDISSRNILLDRREGTKGGGWGVLIDFDMAIFLDREASQVRTDFRTGTRAFQSLKVLHGLGTHDHLDELESCFYVFSWVLFTFQGPGAPVAKLPDFLESWESGDPKIASAGKRSFLIERSLRLKLSGWPASARLLFSGLQSLFAQIAIPRVTHLLEEQEFEKMNLSEDEKNALREEAENVIKDALGTLPEVDSTNDCNDWLTVEAKRHYLKILNLIDTAIMREMSQSTDPRDHVEVAGPSNYTIEESDEERDLAPGSTQEGIQDTAEESAPASGRASPEPVEQHHEPVASANPRSRSTSYSYSSVHSNKRSASQEPEPAANVSVAARKVKRVKGSHSKSRDR
ncbi:hypothetical protein OE88DRAFT_1663188 [Heliocybe sulcata]|uniref:Protein kinase domain-containing protein n=1 Tax=Heliocybe sulcata TaxID=5364 RepID=A0A5C3MYS4_9AGAM|nr:hypothetical protein OE88DRAFT_1663188 [Heliocybe sulcata]